MPLVLVEEWDAGRFDLVADAVCLRAVVACAPDGGPRLLEEGVVPVGLVRQGADPLSSGTVEDDDGFVTGGPEFPRVVVSAFTTRPRPSRSSVSARTTSAALTIHPFDVRTGAIDAADARSGAAGEGIDAEPNDRGAVTEAVVFDRTADDLSMSRSLGVMRGPAAVSVTS